MPYANCIVPDWYYSRTLLKKELNDDTDATLIQLTYRVLENLRIARMPWYLKDADGWPIERIYGQHIQNFLRVVILNFRKLFIRKRAR